MLVFSARFGPGRTRGDAGIFEMATSRTVRDADANMEEKEEWMDG